MKTLVSGLGSIGLRHARNLRQLGIENIAGFDPSADRRAAFEQEICGQAYESYAQALEAQPDLVVVASPSVFHIAQAREAVAAGCHLLIEKPFGSTRDGVDDLVREIAARERFVHVGSNWKFHPAFMTMKRLLDDGAVGRITGAQVLSGHWLPDWHPHEDYRKGYSARRDLGGGAVLDSHEFDYLSWLIGPVRDIVGFSGRTGLLDIDTEDVACACLLFECGALATIHVDYIQRRHRRHYHISGEAGTVEWENLGETVTLYDAEKQTTDSFPVPTTDVNAMYVDQMRHVLDGIRDGSPAVTSAETASRVLDLQLKLRDSLIASTS